MTNPSNLPQLDFGTSDVTVTFFNNYFLPNFTVSQNVDDAILGFFEKITQNTESAKILASAVIYTSLARNLDTIEVLTKFSTLAEGELNSYISMFLNLNRIGTSYLGINNFPQVSKYVQRTILP